VTSGWGVGSAHPGTLIASLHVDCDLSSSTKAIFNGLGDPALDDLDRRRRGVVSQPTHVEIDHILHVPMACVTLSRRWAAWGDSRADHAHLADASVLQ
jgi:hypothetical protein